MRAGPETARGPVEAGSELPHNCAEVRCPPETAPGPVEVGSDELGVPAVRAIPRLVQVPDRLGLRQDRPLEAIASSIRSHSAFSAASVVA